MYSTYDETKVKEEDRARSFAFYKDLEKAVAGISLPEDDFAFGKVPFCTHVVAPFVNYQ